MTYKITRREEQVPNIWSGGKTNQLFLHPAKSSYAARDFYLRISSATIEEEISVFTSLPGFKRILMPISGTIKLVFEGHGDALIKPFETVEFSGSWLTTSSGKCTDIGIMLGEGWQGSLAAVGSGEYECRGGFSGVYALEDGVKIKAGGEFAGLLNKGDFLLAEQESQRRHVLTLETNILHGAVIVNAWTVACA